MRRGESPLLVDKIGGAGSQDVATMMENVTRTIDDGTTALVVSGPGGPAGRVTDLAIGAVGAWEAGQGTATHFGEITDRLVAHAEPLGAHAVSLAIGTARSMREGLEDGRGQGWVVMAPERYQAEIYQHLSDEAGVQATILNPSTHIQRDASGAIDFASSTSRLSRHMRPSGLTILPGTPGVDSDLRIVPVTQQLRGYSDATGMVAAAALREAAGGQDVMYRIIKGDVPGILRMPPGLGRQPAIAPSLDVVEAWALGLAGNGVVQPAVLDLLQLSDVRLTVCSGRPGEPGTIIERARVPSEDETIAGIALQEVVAYTIKDIRMEHQQGTIGDVAAIFNQFDMPIVDMVTGPGVITTYVSKAMHDSRRAELPGAFEARYNGQFSLAGADDRDGLSIITLVGAAMTDDSELRVRVMQDAVNVGKALGIGGVGFWPSPARNAIYLSVPTERAKNYAAKLYDKFFPVS